MSRILKALAIIASITLAAAARADTHLRYTDAKGDTTVQYFVKDGKIRTENGPGQPVTIFDTANPMMIIINPVNKRYAIFDQHTEEHLSAKLLEAERQLTEATAKQSKKPPDTFATMTQHGLPQTAVVHAIIDYFVSTMVSKRIKLTAELKPLGTHRTILGVVCEDEQLLINGHVGETRCVAHDLDKLGIPAKDRATMWTNLDDYRQFMTAIEPVFKGISTTLPNGLPLQSEKDNYDVAAHKLVHRTDTLVAVTNETLDTSLFAPPAGYTAVSPDDLWSSDP